MRVLITRPQDDAERTAARVAALGHEPVIAPLARIVPTRRMLPPDPPDALIATSRNALPAAAEPAFSKIVPIFAVGAETAAAASALGFHDVRDGGGTAALTAGRIRADVPAGARLLYCAGVPRKPDLERMLAQDFVLDVVEVYRTEYVTVLPQNVRAGLTQDDPLAVLHLSRGAAEAFVHLTEEAGLIRHARRAYHLVVSDDAAAPLRRAGCLRTAVAEAPGLDRVLELLPTSDASRGGR